MILPIGVDLRPRFLSDAGPVASMAGIKIGRNSSTALSEWPEFVARTADIAVGRAEDQSYGQSPAKKCLKQRLLTRFASARSGSFGRTGSSHWLRFKPL